MIVRVEQNSSLFNNNIMMRALTGNMLFVVLFYHKGALARSLEYLAHGGQPDEEDIVQDLQAGQGMID